MTARTRTARRTLRQRSATTRAAAKIRREGVATLATHCLAAGLDIKEAASVAGSRTTAFRFAGIVTARSRRSPSRFHSVAIGPKGLRYDVFAQVNSGSILGAITTVLDAAARLIPPIVWAIQP